MRCISCRVSDSPGRYKRRCRFLTGASQPSDQYCRNICWRIFRCFQNIFCKICYMQRIFLTFSLYFRMTSLKPYLCLQRKSPFFGWIEYQGLQFLSTQIFTSLNWTYLDVGIYLYSPSEIFSHPDINHFMNIQTAIIIDILSDIYRLNRVFGTEEPADIATGSRYELRDDKKWQQHKLVPERFSSLNSQNPLLCVVKKTFNREQPQNLFWTSWYRW